ncbi:MAG: WXG100 family type VII secretion target [bacterium]|nr:WXG100 family type VII secretion target [bacterium]
MAQAVVDPEQLRQFAAMLKRYSQQIRESTATLTQAQARLAESWRDQEHRKFAEQFEEQLKAVQKLLEATDEHVPYLLKKAEIIEQYLQR